MCDDSYARCVFAERLPLQVRQQWQQRTLLDVAWPKGPTGQQSGAGVRGADVRGVRLDQRSAARRKRLLTPGVETSVSTAGHSLYNPQLSEIQSIQVGLARL